MSFNRQSSRYYLKEEQSVCSDSFRCLCNSSYRLSPRRRVDRCLILRLLTRPSIHQTGNFSWTRERGERWRQKFISQRITQARIRARLMVFFSKNCRNRKNNEPSEAPTKQARFYVEKYNESLGRISIVINVCIYSSGMSVGMSKVYICSMTQNMILVTCLLLCLKFIAIKIIENEIFYT